MKETMQSAPRCVQCNAECPYGMREYPSLIVCHNPECPNYGLFQVGREAMEKIDLLSKE